MTGPRKYLPHLLAGVVLASLASVLALGIAYHRILRTKCEVHRLMSADLQEVGQAQRFLTFGSFDGTVARTVVFRALGRYRALGRSSSRGTERTAARRLVPVVAATCMSGDILMPCDVPDELLFPCMEAWRHWAWHYYLQEADRKS